MGSIHLGAERAINEYLRVNQNHRVVIITDRPRLPLAKALRGAARKRTEDVPFFVLEDFCTGRRRKIPTEIRDSYEDPSNKVISFYMTGEYSGRYELIRLEDPIANFIDQTQPTHIKHLSLPTLSKKIMQQGFCVPLNLIKKYTTLIYNRVKNSKRFEIYSPGGTELEIKVDSKNIGWRKEDHLDFGFWENLPFGEIYTSPIDCNGKLVIDLMIGEGFEFEYGFDFLRKYPVTFQIKNGEVINMTCKRKTRLIGQLEEEMFHRDNQASSVGEIGLGTNFGLKGLIGNLLQDEKFPGIHLGIGAADPYCGKEWDSNTHIDMMMLKPDVLVDGKPLIKNGNYALRNHNPN